MYLFAGLAPPNQFERAQREFARASVRSGSSSREEAAGIRPNRVDVYTVRSGDTWQSIAQRTGDRPLKPSTLAIMNNYEPTAAARRRPHQGRRRGLAVDTAWHGRVYNLLRMRRIGRSRPVGPACRRACVGYAAYLYLTLPDVRVLRTTNPETTAFMRAARARGARRGEEPRRVQKWVSYARISPHLKRAVLVAEDSAFWQHDGVDFEQLKESMEVNIERMEFARGGSTITQQLAKNLYLSPSKNPHPQAPRAADRASARDRAHEAAHPRALSERDRVGRRHLRRRSGGATPLSEVRRGARRAGVRAARGGDRQSARARSRPSDRAAAPAPADGHARGWGPCRPPPVVRRFRPPTPVQARRIDPPGGAWPAAPTRGLPPVLPGEAVPPVGSRPGGSRPEDVRP